MPKAMHVRRTGGPEVLEWEEIEVGAPGPGEARVRHTATGVNFVDTYYRSGLYPAPGGLPYIPGAEGAGVVEAIGPGVSEVAPGDRVVYHVSAGSYAEERLIEADRLIKIPDGIADDVAAASFLKGLTVQCLIRRTFRVEKGQFVLWHAAAGGVGTLGVQWLAALGAVVIGTAGSDEKTALARANGCAHVINYRREDFVARVKEITGGEGVHVVYDSVGKDTFPGSLDCLRPLGMWVSFGQSSGLPPPFPVSLLQHKGCLFATRPVLGVYVRRRADLEASAAELFEAIGSGILKVAINLRLPLARAAEAHAALESRRTTGATVLLPDGAAA